VPVARLHCSIDRRLVLTELMLTANETVSGSTGKFRLFLESIALQTPTERRITIRSAGTAAPLTC
jgi:hypothetical protein